jgi:hypothetical protein
MSTWPILRKKWVGLFVGLVIVSVGMGWLWWRESPSTVSQPFLGKVVLLHYTPKGAHDISVIDTHSLAERRYSLKDRPYNNVSVRDNDIYLSIYRENKGPLGTVSAGNRIAHYRLDGGKARFIREIEIPGYHPTTVWITTDNVFVLARRLEAVVDADERAMTGIVVLDRKNDKYKGLVSFGRDFVDSRWDFVEEKQRLFFFGQGTHYQEPGPAMDFVQFLEINLADISVSRTFQIHDKKDSDGLTLSGLVKHGGPYKVTISDSKNGQKIGAQIITFDKTVLEKRFVSEDFYDLVSAKGQSHFWATNGESLLRLNKKFEIVASVPCAGIRDIKWVAGKLWVVRRATLFNGFGLAPSLVVYDPETLTVIKEFEGSYGHVAHHF